MVFLVTVTLSLPSELAFLPSSFLGYSKNASSYALLSFHQRHSPPPISTSTYPPQPI